MFNVLLCVMYVRIMGLYHAPRAPFNIHPGVGRYCWIGNGTAAVVIFGVPVALILIFNVIALARTVLAIRKTREVMCHVLILSPDSFWHL